MFNWNSSDEEQPPTQEQIDAAEAYADVIQICRRFSREPANCHSFMSVSSELMKKYIKFNRTNRAKAIEYNEGAMNVVTRHLGAKGDATHEDICQFAPEHPVGRGDRPPRRQR